MEYFIKASAVMALFYTCYKLFLQKETFFQSNRWFLLVGLIIAVAFPFVIIPEYVIIEPISISQGNTFVGIPITTDLTVITEEKSFDYTTLIPILYGIGAAFFFIRFLLQFGSLILLLIKNPKNKDGIYTYIIVKNDISPFSFFKWIVYNPEQFNTKELQLILNHERVHVRQYHSIDIIITQLVSVIFWWNPLIWLYKKDIHQNLEYIADHLAQTVNDDEKIYQKLLLKTSVANYDTALTNNFYNSLIKKRIVMLHKSKSKAIKQWKIAIVLPLLTIFLMSVNREKVFIEKENTLVSNVEKGETLEFVVTKNTTDTELNLIIQKFKEIDHRIEFRNKSRNDKNELIDIYTKYDDSGLSNGNNKTPIESFIIYRELFGEEGVFIGRSNGAISFFDNSKGTDNHKLSFDNQFNKFNKLKKRAHKAILKNGIQSEKDLKKEQTSISITNGNIEAIFTKSMTDEGFKKHKKSLKEKNVSFKIKQLERNDKGEISTINIDFITKNGTANHSANNNSGIPINDFKFYMKDNGEFGVADIKNKQKSFFSYVAFSSNMPDSIHFKDDIIRLHGNSKIEYGNTSLRTDTLSNINYNNLNIIKDFKDKNPLYILDGKPISAKKAQQLKQEEIASINVIKGENAIKTYGKQAKNGVVVIISKKESQKIDLNKQQDNFKIRTPQDQQPLYVIDGEIVDEEVFNKLKDGDIQTINVLKDKAATDLYSEKAKHGVIVVRTKRNTTPVYILNGKVITDAQVKKLETTNSIKNLEVIHHKKELIKEKYNIDTNGDVIIIETKEDKVPDYIINDTKVKIVDPKQKNINISKSKEVSRKTIREFAPIDYHPDTYEFRNSNSIFEKENNTPPVYILNGKVIDEAEVKNLETSNRISEITVLNKEEEKKKYNINTKGALILIEVKDEKNKELLFIDNFKFTSSDSKIEEAQKLSENQKNQKLYVTTQSVTSNANYGGILVNLIDKEVDDETFKRLTFNYAKDNIDLQFSNTIRNENQEITSITIHMKNTLTGKIASASFNDENGIPKIFIGYTGPVNNKPIND